MRDYLVGVNEVKSFQYTSGMTNDEGSVEHVSVIGVCILIYSC